jgi:hypothetical protein
MTILDAEDIETALGLLHQLNRLHTGSCVVSEDQRIAFRALFHLAQHRRWLLLQLVSGCGFRRLAIITHREAALETGRLLLMSPFAFNARRTSARLAWRRNAFVASLADETVFAYTTRGGHTDRLRSVLIAEGKPVLQLHVNPYPPISIPDNETSV